MSKINGGQETAQAIVNQEPKEAMTNPVNVKDVKALLEKLHLVAKVPSSLIRATDEPDGRQATDEEKEWIKNYYASLYFEIPSGNRMPSNYSYNGVETIEIAFGFVIYASDDFDISFAEQYHIVYYKETNVVHIYTEAY